MSDCLTEDQLADLAEGRAPLGGRAAIDAHLDECALCRSALAAMSNEPITQTSGLFTSTESPTVVRKKLPATGDRLGRYLLLDVLGAGGMGVVFRAYDPQLDRKVAIKLLRTAGWSPEQTEALKARLLREAQAMARLSHPNVLPVYDSGLHEDHLYIAMELVDGSTLRQWQHRSRRNVFQIRRAYYAAGKGLMAAHQAGLVHRDFKPDNVLVGKDAQIRVTDFGLARLDQSKSPPSELFSEELSHSGRKVPEPAPTGALATPMTRAGSVVGTPVYMAPEQLRGEDSHAAADQFAFAVALWEALTGKLPFPGQTPEELLAAIEKGDVREARRVRWPLRGPLLRALSADPAKRFPSMRQLLERVEPSTLRRPWLWAAAAVAALLLVVNAVPALHAAPCANEGRRLEGVWDTSRKTQGQAFFAKSARPFAKESWQLTSSALDIYAKGWIAEATEVCEATRVRKEQSEELFALRSACLDRRRRELSAVTALVVSPSDQVIEDAPGLVRGLTPLERCSDAASLRAVVRPNLDAQGQARLLALEDRRAKAMTLIHFDRAAEAAEEFEAIRQEAVALKVVDLEIDALRQKGRALSQAGNNIDAEKALHTATTRAIANGLGADVADGLLELSRVVGVEQGRVTEGEHLSAYAGAQLELMGGDARRETARLVTLAWIRDMDGDAEGAIRYARRAIDLSQHLGPGSELVVARAHDALLGALGTAGQVEEAEREGLVTIGLFEHLWGTENPSLGMPLNNFGLALRNAGRMEQAETILKHALRVQSGRRPSHPDVLMVKNNLGDLALLRGHPADALPLYTEVLDAVKVSRNADTVGARANALSGLGGALLALHRTAEAIPQLEAAVTAYVQLGAEPVQRAETLAWLGEALWEQGEQRERARVLIEEARATLGSDSRGAVEYGRVLRALEAWAHAHGVELKG